jgi:hypothetical protein
MLCEPGHGGGLDACGARLLSHAQQSYVARLIQNITGGLLQLSRHLLELVDDLVCEGRLFHFHSSRMTDCNVA